MRRIKLFEEFEQDNYGVVLNLKEYDDKVSGFFNPVYAVRDVNYEMGKPDIIRRLQTHPKYYRHGIPTPKSSSVISEMDPYGEENLNADLEEKYLRMSENFDKNFKNLFTKYMEFPSKILFDYLESKGFVFRHSKPYQTGIIEHTISFKNEEEIYKFLRTFRDFLNEQSVNEK